MADNTDITRTVSSAFKGSRVLVTGGCGFIGSHLVDRLVSYGALVWVIDNLQSGKTENLSTSKKNVELIIGDVRDSSCVDHVLHMSSPKYVFHLAANASVPGSVENPEYDFETNSLGTFVLLNALRNIKSESRVVLASSGAVYGQPQIFPIVEAHRIDPISPYGGSKTCAEAIAKVYARVYELPVVTARIFNTYGPRMPRFVVLDFLRKLQEDPRNLRVLGDGKQRRDFSFVTDILFGLMLLAVSGSAMQAYNLSSGTSVSITDLALVLIDILGLKNRTTISYTGTSWPGDAHRWEVSNDKIVQLGYLPEVSLKDGLIKTIKWHRSLNFDHDNSSVY